MSRPQPGPPKRVPSAPVPPNARKASQPIQPGPAGAGVSTGRGGSPAKFYDGPTVSKAKKIPEHSKDLAKKTVSSAKAQTKQAVAVARRHPWSIASLITTIPFLVIISLFSTVICPPPNSQGTLSKYVLSPLGLSHPAPHGSLHQTLCYPANVYNAEVLEPYVYPLINRAQERVSNHPVYVKGVEPVYTKARTTGEKVWNGPVRPVVTRVQREIRRAYLTFVQPHIPYFKTKFHTITAPYTSRVAALHNQYLHPQIAAAQSYANSAKDQTVKSYKYAASHPITGHAGRYANLGYQVGRKRSIQAYNYSKPHVIKGAKEAERIAREILGPRVIKGLEVAGHQVAKGYGFTKRRVVGLYNTHLDPHVGPHIRQLSKSAAPHVERFNQNIYRPYIRPALEAILPQFLFTPEPPRTFWAMIADFLPTAGNHAAERKGSMNEGYGKVKSKTAEVKGKVQASTASVKSKASASASPSRSASPSPSPSASKADVRQHKFDRAQMEQLRDNLKAQIEDQGKKGYKQVKSELAALHKDILGTKFPMLQQGSRAEIEQDINYVVTGLDKLYSKSTKLTREQVSKSSSQADSKIQSKATKVKSKLDGLKHDWHEAGRPIVRKAFQPLDKLVLEKDQLVEKMATVDDVNPKDFTKVNQLQLNVDSWKDKYMGLHNGSIKDRQLSDPSVSIDKNIADLFTEMDDMIEGFRARVGILKRTALDRIEARSALAAESASSSSSSSSATASKSSSTDSGRVSILPIAPENAGAGLGGAGAIIGKGKQQVEDALKQASQAVAGSDRASILPIVSDAAGAGAGGVGGVIGKGKQQIEDALSQASQAVAGSGRASILPIAPDAAGAGLGAGAIIGKGKEQIEDALSQASQAVAGSTPTGTGPIQQARSVAENVVSSASSVVHDATRSVASAVGASQPSNGAAEYLESIAQGVQQGAASVYAQAGSGIHEATRSVISAVGATPSPEGLAEHAKSLVEAASSSAASIGSVASQAVHDGTRSAISAVGGTPSPESAGDYVSAASASASSIGSVVADAVHSGTKSAISAVSAGGDYINVKSAVDQASNSASSIGSVVSGAVHDATRSVISAAGGTPTPESPKEHLDSLLHAGSAQVDDATRALASMANQISALLAPSPSATPAPVAAYLAALSARGVEAGGDLLSSGSAILASLSTDLHTATRSLAKKVGATAAPEGLGERVEDAFRKVGELGEDVKEGVKQVVGRDEL